MAIEGRWGNEDVRRWYTHINQRDKLDHWDVSHQRYAATHQMGYPWKTLEWYTNRSPVVAGLVLACLTIEGQCGINALVGKLSKNLFIAGDLLGTLLTLCEQMDKQFNETLSSNPPTQKETNHEHSI
jgi:hypothetical protein